jgi:hypothetical protein
MSEQITVDNTKDEKEEELGEKEIGGRRGEMRGEGEERKEKSVQ